MHVWSRQQRIKYFGFLSLFFLFFSSFLLPLSLPPPYFFSRRRACECIRASCDVILVLSLWLLQVTWKWGNDRDVSWKSFSGPASSISNSSRTRDVGVASGGTQFCWTSGLSTRMTSQFAGESSFRCRLLLNAQDAGRWVWFLNVAHELFLGNG